MSNKKIKIFAIIPSGFCFGLQHVTVDFFRKFTKVESLFLVTGWNDGELIKLLNQNYLKYTISWLGMFSRKLDWYYLKMSLISLSRVPKLYYDFYKTIRAFKPEVLFFANHHELILLLPVLRFKKIPIVCHMHDPAPVSPFQRHTFAHYSGVVTKFIAISENVRQRTIELGCAPEKVITLHNGIELPGKQRIGRTNDFLKKFNWNENVFVVGITGQMTPTKGHMDLLNAFNTAYQQNKNLRLAIGGRGNEPFYSELKTHIKKLELVRVVEFTGWLAEVSLFFNNIDLFVLASRHDEGYGLVVAEAMANGLPVVITNSGGAAEIVENEINGYIVPKGDTDQMAERILFLSLNPSLCVNMASNGQQRIKTEFNLTNQAELLQQQLLEITANAVRK